MAWGLPSPRSLDAVDATRLIDAGLSVVRIAARDSGPATQVGLPLRERHVREH